MYVVLISHGSFFDKIYADPTPECEWRGNREMAFHCCSVALMLFVLTAAHWEILRPYLILGALSLVQDVDVFVFFNCDYEREVFPIEIVLKIG
jgi:hypothetical protein